MSKRDHTDSCHFVVLDADGINRHNCSVRTVGRRRRVRGLLWDVKYGVDSPDPRRVSIISSTYIDP